MKDTVISLILTAVLILTFSAFPAGASLPSGGVSPQFPGDSGMILPGGGAGMVEFTMGQPQKSGPGDRPETGVTTEEAGQYKSEEVKEEQSKMNEIVLAFWHGVATVLIGETAALMVAVAWMKIRRLDDRLRGE